MKFTTVIVATAFAAVASAGTLTNTDPHPNAVQDYCNEPGQPCEVFKRAAAAIAEANADPEADPEAVAKKGVHHFCYRVGEPCSKAKRNAIAMAEAVAEAHAAAQPDADAWLNNLPVLHEKRSNVSTIRTAAIHHFCYRIGEPCFRVKRVAEAIATAAAQPAAEPEAEAKKGVHHFCYRVGEPCSKHKRAIEDLANSVADLET
ncbi:putative serine/threonine protein phosphatase [Agyrium rufum]|nr:putative serine/threonine protein phosphatase [Agyrium rufum]